MQDFVGIAVLFIFSTFSRRISVLLQASGTSGRFPHRHRRTCEPPTGCSPWMKGIVRVGVRQFDMSTLRHRRVFPLSLTPARLQTPTCLSSGTGLVKPFWQCSNGPPGQNVADHRQTVLGLGGSVRFWFAASLPPRQVVSGVDGV